MSNGALSKVGPDQIDITNQYLTVLALEYKMLSRNNQQTDETLKEIYYLLRAINRLDSRADWFWIGNGNVPNDFMSAFPETANLNGFILREDMYSNYVSTYHKDFNYALREDPLNATSFTGLPETTGLDADNKFSDYVGFGGTKAIGDLSLPHDKYYSMFIAFMMLIKYIPDNTGYYENGQLQYFQDNESDIKTEIRKITTRCHQYLRGNTFGNQVTNWMMEYPNGNNLQNLGQPIFYSYPLSKMICHIQEDYPWSWPCDSEQDAVSLAAGFVFYEAFSINPIPSITPLIGSEDAAVFLADCMAGSNAPFWTPTVPPIPIPACIAMDLNTSINSVEWADLLRRVLHQNGILMKQKSVYANPIDVAPCNGPYNFGSNNYPTWEWSSQDRSEHPSSRGSNSPVAANYPGVDYMLLHNLYYEYLNQEDDDGNSQTGKYNAYNLMDNYDEQTWPYTVGIFNNPITFGTTSNIENTKVFQNLQSRAQIYASVSPAAPFNSTPSYVKYRAGKEIALLPESYNHPGFSVEYGSEFEARVQRYVCTISDYGSGMRPGQNQNVSINDFEIDSMNTSIPIHHIDHPLSDSDLNPGKQNDNMYTAEALNSNEQALIQKNNDANGITGNSIETTARFEILPNPSSGIFKVVVNALSQNEIFTLDIVDMKGEVILHEQDYTSRSFDFTNYSKGVYLIRITSDFGYKNSKKISITGE